MAFIFVTVALDRLAVGMIAPVLPGLVKQFLGGNTSQAAEMYGFFATAWGIMQFVCSSILGSLSDRYGRRPVILLLNFGLGLDYFVTAVAPTLLWLLVGRAISGATSASIPTAMADITPLEKRSGAFGMISAAFGLGFILGPAFGGLLGHYNPRLPFWVAGALSLLNACYGLFVLPESLPLERRASFSWKQANPFGAFTLLRSHKELVILAVTMFLGYLAQQPIGKAMGDRSSLNIGLIFGALGPRRTCLTRHDDPLCFTLGTGPVARRHQQHAKPHRPVRSGTFHL